MYKLSCLLRSVNHLDFYFALKKKNSLEKCVKWQGPRRGDTKPQDRTIHWGIFQCGNQRLKCAASTFSFVKHWKKGIILEQKHFVCSFNLDHVPASSCFYLLSLCIFNIFSKSVIDWNIRHCRALQREHAKISFQVSLFGLVGLFLKFTHSLDS